MTNKKVPAYAAPNPRDMPTTSTYYLTQALVDRGYELPEAVELSWWYFFDKPLEASRAQVEARIGRLARRQEITDKHVELMEKNLKLVRQQPFYREWDGRYKKESVVEDEDLFFGRRTATEVEPGVDTKNPDLYAYTVDGGKRFLALSAAVALRNNGYVVEMIDEDN